MKKIISIIAALAVLTGVGFFYIQRSNTAEINTELSERSKEFLEERRKEGNLEFAGVNQAEDGVPLPSSSVVSVGDCFEIMIPFVIESEKDLGECFKQISTTAPRAMINVYTRDVSYDSLDSDSGVKMRRMETEVYKEEVKVVNGASFVIFQKTDAGYEKTALFLSGGELFSLNLISATSDDSLDGKFDEMLESVEIR